MRQQTSYLRRLLAPALLAAALLGASVALAQTGGGYDLTWSTIDAGGGSSVGGGYQLSGTIGQPDAGATLSGGVYSLSGGFWGSAPASSGSQGSELYLPQLRR
jgi:hypothetical protein